MDENEFARVLERRCRKAIWWGSLSGAAVGTAAWIAFGVLDVQCRGDARGPSWNAELQRCEPSPPHNQRDGI